jgi:hypothetical protein
MHRLRGVAGSLVPGQFLAEATIRPYGPPAGDAARARFLRWWRHAEAQTGPATAVRAIFDLVAMPLAALLGFRAHDARIDRDRAVVRLTTRSRRPLLLIVRPWASRPPQPWRDIANDARDIGADWCLLVAPPFVSIVDARSHARRRSLDFTWPDCTDARSLSVFLAFCAAAAFEAHGPAAAPVPIDDLLARAAAFHDRVRADLQNGVVASLASIVPAVGGRTHRHAFDEALTIVYRILFLLFAESRDLVPARHPAYAPAYAMTSLCEASALSTVATTGLWDALAAITRLSRAGCEVGDLIVRPFNGRLFARTAAPTVESGARGRRPTTRSTQRDRALAGALVALGSRPGPAGRQAIAYADLGVEQLGAVYERLLDVDPAEFDGLAPTPVRRADPGSGRHSPRRKETGTFYTPQPPPAASRRARRPRTDRRLRPPTSACRTRAPTPAVSRTTRRPPIP